MDEASSNPPEKKDDGEAILPKSLQSIDWKDAGLLAELLKNWDDFQETPMASRIWKNPPSFSSLLGSGITTPESAAVQRSRRELAKLRESINSQTSELEQIKNDRSKFEEKANNLASSLAKYERLESMRHILDSISTQAHDRLELNPEFLEEFSESSEISAFVISIDIRRSTELMLKAKKPSSFAEFITVLCGDLENIVKNNWGVFDKFTGDGVLAFFPTFFTGEDAGYFALKTAKEANLAFAKRYQEARSSFTALLKDVGLGVGIDYGNIQLVRMAGSLTVVGQPVVYACRFGGAPAGHTFLNQPAYELIDSKYSQLATLEETFLEIKSEGRLICYDAKLGDRSYSPAMPPWFEKYKPKATDDENQQKSE